MDSQRLGTYKKKARRSLAHLIFLDESGFSLSPPIRGTWAPRGKTPILHHSFKREHLSVIGALGVSAKKESWNAWCLVYEEALSAIHVQAFLSMLLKTLPGNLILLWDGGAIHKDRALQQFLGKHPRLEVHKFPGYAPELNPAEHLWNILKERMRHYAPRDVAELYERYQEVWREVAKSKSLLRSCIHATPMKHP